MYHLQPLTPLEPQINTDSEESHERESPSVAILATPQVDLSALDEPTPLLTISDMAEEQVDVSMADTTDGGNEADVSRLSATQVSTDLGALTPAPSIEEEEAPSDRTVIQVSPDCGGVDANSPPPPFSQIPEISIAVTPVAVTTDTIANLPQSPSPKELSPSLAFLVDQEVREISPEVISETQRTTTESTQTSRLSESFTESQLPRIIPLIASTRSRSPEVVIISPKRRSVVPQVYSRPIPINRVEEEALESQQNEQDEAASVVYSHSDDNSPESERGISAEVTRIDETSSAASSCTYFPPHTKRCYVERKCIFTIYLIQLHQVGSEK